MSKVKKETKNESTTPAEESIEDAVETIEDAVEQVLESNPLPKAPMVQKPSIKPKEKKEEPLDLSPIMDKIDEGFKNLEKVLTDKKTPIIEEPKKRNYQLFDEFDPTLPEIEG